MHAQPTRDWLLLLALTVVTLVGCSAPGTPVPATTQLASVSAQPQAPAAPARPSTPTAPARPSTPATTTQPSAAATTARPGTPATTTQPSAAAGPRMPGLPDVGVAGVNNADCRSADPPVVLLHGSFATVSLSFSALVPALLSAHRCVYGIDYGNDGTGPIRGSATAVAAFADRVRVATGARQVDVIAFSQGGLVLRTALRLDGLADRVRVAVLIAPSFHGTTAALASSIPAALCPACADQAAGSALLRQLNAGGDLDGAVRYAVISTRNDTVVTPVSSQVPAGPPNRVVSIVIQAVCPALHPGHVSMPSLPAVIGWTVAALTTGGRPATTDLHCA